MRAAFCNRGWGKDIANNMALLGVEMGYVPFRKLKKMKTVLTLISLALGMRILLGLIVNRTTLAHEPNSKEFRLFDHRRKSSFPLERSREYCNGPGQEIDGLEGIPPKPSMKLLGTVLLVRHGDRLPISRPPAFNNHPPPEHQPCSLDASSMPKTPLLEPFMKTISNHEDEIRSSMNPFLKNFDLLPDTCSDVSITQTGIVQMLELGKFLGQRYMAKGTDSDNQQEVVISTSRFARTFQSLISFLFGFSPNHFLKMLSGGMSTSSTIYFCDSDLPTTPSHSSNCDCVAPMNIPKLRATFRYWDLNIPSISYLYRTLKIDAERDKKIQQHSSNSKKIGPPPLAITSPSRVWDWLVSEYYCAGLPPPCVPDDFGDLGDCLNSSVIESLIHLVDDNHLRMVEDPDYIKATSLVMYPFLDSINKKFHELVEEESECSRHGRRKKYPYLWIVSGHDITIGPLLVALRFPQLTKVPYATRVAFELWGSCSDDGKIQPHIRILLNGKDITGNIWHCGTGNNFSDSVRSDNSQTRQQSNPCPLFYFDHFLNVDFFSNLNVTDYESACRG